MRFHLSFLTFIICFGCISLIAKAEPYLKALVSDVSCFGKNDGKIELMFLHQQPADFRISVSDSLNQKIVEFDTLFEKPMLVQKLSPGNYSILITTPDTSEKQIVSIGSPHKLQLEIIKIIKVEGNGTSVLSTLQAFPTGGTPPYAYQWSENSGKQQDMIAKKLPLGVYNCKVDDNNKCGVVEATFYLFEDEIENFKQESNIK